VDRFCRIVFHCVTPTASQTTSQTPSRTLTSTKSQSAEPYSPTHRFFLQHASRLIDLAYLGRFQTPRCICWCGKCIRRRRWYAGIDGGAVLIPCKSCRLAVPHIAHRPAFICKLERQANRRGISDTRPASCVPTYRHARPRCTSSAVLAPLTFTRSAYAMKRPSQLGSALPLTGVRTASAHNWRRGSQSICLGSGWVMRYCLFARSFTRRTARVCCSVCRASIH